MKKFAMLAVLVAIIFTLAACGSTPETASSASSAAPSSSTASSSQAPESAPEAPAEEVFEATLWSAQMPEELVRKEDSGRDEEKYTSLTFEYRKDPASEHADSSLDIVVALEDSPRSFRGLISDTTAELKDYADGVGTVEIGGIKFSVKEFTSWGSEVTKYTGRDEASSAVITITITGELDEALSKTVLDSFKLTAPDIGHVDPPWPWDGVRLEPVTSPVMVGSFTITPEYIAADEPLVLNDIMRSQIAVVGDSIYAVTNSEMIELLFAADKQGVTLNRSEMLDTTYEHMTRDNAGNLYLSPGLGEIVVMQGFDKVFQSSLKYDLAIHPSGTWGITSWVGSDTMKVTVGDGVMSAEPWVLTNLNKDAERNGAFSMISQIEVNENHVMVAGKHVEANGEAIVIYDTAGAELFMLAKTEAERTGLGSITGIVETPNGFLATDGNMRDIILWNKTGEFIGSINVKELLGASYCWLEDVQRLEDGSIIVAISQRREDASAEELAFFRLTGF